MSDAEWWSGMLAVNTIDRLDFRPKKKLSSGQFNSNLNLIKYLVTNPWTHTKPSMRINGAHICSRFVCDIGMAWHGMDKGFDVLFCVSTKTQNAVPSLSTLNFNGLRLVCSSFSSRQLRVAGIYFIYRSPFPCVLILFCCNGIKEEEFRQAESTKMMNFENLTPFVVMGFVRSRFAHCFVVCIGICFECVRFCEHGKYEKYLIIINGCECVCTLRWQTGDRT